MNLIRVDIELRCEQGQAELLVGHVDHVEYGSDTGIAKVHLTSTSEDHLLVDANKALDGVPALLAAAGISLDSVLSLSLGSEALIEDNGVWRRRGEVVTESLARGLIHAEQ